MLSLFILISNSCLADATPKFNPNPTLEFYLDGNKTKIDSILVKTYLKNSKSIDTLFFSKYRRDFSQNVILQDDYGIKMDIRTPIDKFQLTIIQNNKLFNSEIISFKGDKSFLRFKLEKGKIKDDSPLFYAKWKHYFTSLFITISIEILVLLFLLRKVNVDLKKIIILIILANLITHPTLWFIDSHFNTYNIILEIGVVVVEFLFLSTLMSKISKINWLNIVLKINLFSWLIGGVLYFFATI